VLAGVSIRDKQTSETLVSSNHQPHLQLAARSLSPKTHLHDPSRKYLVVNMEGRWRSQSLELPPPGQWPVPISSWTRVQSCPALGQLGSQAHSLSHS
jgi:hypothetical protein